MNKRHTEAAIKLWKKVENLAYAVGKHPDELYSDLIIQFSEFVEKKYPTKKYLDEKVAKERIKHTIS